MSTIPNTPEGQEVINKENEERGRYLVKKFNLEHLEQDERTRFQILKELVEKHGVSAQDYRKGLMPEEVTEARDNLQKAKIKSRSVLGHHYNKALREGNLKNFEEEYKASKVEAVQVKETEESIAEARENYEEYESPDNLKEYVKKSIPTFQRDPEENRRLEAERKKAENEARAERMREGVIENNAKDLAHQMKKDKIAREIGGYQQQRVREALTDKRVMHNIGSRGSTPKKSEMDEAIEQRAEEIMEASDE